MRYLPLVFLVTACTIKPFVDIGDNAPILSLDRPSDFNVLTSSTPAPFGARVTHMEGMVDSLTLSQAIVSGGADTMHATYTIWRNDVANIPFPLNNIDCDEAQECGSQANFATVGVGSFNDEQMCVILSSPEIGQPEGAITISCETGDGTRQRVMGQGDPGISLAALPDGNTIGKVLIGSQNAPGRELSILQEPGSQLDAMTFTGDTSPTMGTRLAVAPLSGGRVLAAALDTTGRVFMFELERDPAAGVNAKNVACVSSVQVPTADGTNQPLALADFTGDGRAELVVTQGDKVRIYETAEVGCANAPNMLAELSCPADLTCGDFGRALAAGDLDGDGALELLVGAPTTTIDEVREVGTVIVYANPLSGPTSTFVTLSEPIEGGKLGSSVDVVRSNLTGTPRSELLSGAPGIDGGAAYVFFCTKHPGDDQPGDLRCFNQ